MYDLPRILSAIELGDAQAAGQLLPLVCEELRRLAAQKLGVHRGNPPQRAVPGPPQRRDPAGKYGVTRIYGVPRI
jgi:hypothetical protein